MATVFKINRFKYSKGCPRSPYTKTTEGTLRLRLRELMSQGKCHFEKINKKNGGWLPSDFYKLLNATTWKYRCREVAAIRKVLSV